jgi:GNAT superfamily N-acetyltransferase
VDDGGGKLVLTPHRVASENAVAMWDALARRGGTVISRRPDLYVVQPSRYHALRAIVLHPHLNLVPQIVDAMVPSPVLRKVVEDASGELDLEPAGFRRYLSMTVMTRDPAPLPPVPPPADLVTIVAVHDTGLLAVAERVIAAVFPPGPVAPDWAGRVQPPRVLGIPGWQVWLGYREDVPACAGYSFYDGTSLGLYTVVTLPEHRGRGLARTLCTTILRAYPDAPANLTATDRGRPLYEELGFAPVSEAAWWMPVPSGDDSRAALG